MLIIYNIIECCEECFEEWANDTTGDAETGTIIVQIQEVQPLKEANEENFLTVPESPTEKMVRFKYRWEKLNNWSSGFFGIGK